MNSIGSDKLSAALAKAKDIGLLEESFTIEDCEITLRNLRPEEFIDIIDACQDLEDVKYLHAYQAEHISRSIVEINGTDLRGVRYVEVDDPKSETPRKVKVELHAYLMENVVQTWSREAVYTAYRKFADITSEAEKRAKQGVVFHTPDETDEDKYRRLLLEAKESEAELPDTLIDHILDEMGYMKKSTAEEYRAAMERTDQLAREQAAAEEKAQAEPVPEPVVEPTKPSPESQELTPTAPAPKQSITDPHATLQQMIDARRQQTPTPTQATPPQQGEKPSRAEQIAQLESQVDGAVASQVKELRDAQGNQIPVYTLPNQERDTPIEIRSAPRDADTIKETVDQPPTVSAGINPRFNPRKNPR